MTPGGCAADRPAGSHGAVSNIGGADSGVLTFKLSVLRTLEVSTAASGRPAGPLALAT
jgi:hypothetical protein